jgi:hypothetical protein
MAVAAVGFASQTHAGTISLVTTLPTITASGDAVGVDIIVDGLPSAAGAFSLDLDYGNLSFVSFLVGPGGTFGTTPADYSLGDLGGSISLVAAYDFLESLDPLTEPAAFAAQNSGGPFVIAHVNFTGIAPGDFTLDLSNVAVSNWVGDIDDPAFNLLIGTNNVPEPMTPLLVAAALGGLALTRKHKAA